MRIMAFDIGDVRTGVAISDPEEKVATPICVIPTQQVIQNAAPFRRLIEDWEPELFVCGLPLSLSGEEGHQAAHIRDIAAVISDTCSIPIEFADERMSSSEAKRMLREMGYDEKGMRGKVDMIAASIFLQAWLDARKG